MKEPNIHEILTRIHFRRDTSKAKKEDIIKAYDYTTDEYDIVIGEGTLGAMRNALKLKDNKMTFDELYNLCIIKYRNPIYKHLFPINVYKYTRTMAFYKKEQLAKKLKHYSRMLDKPQFPVRQAFDLKLVSKGLMTPEEYLIKYPSNE